MKFDKSRLYSAVNADEVKAGSYGLFADSISTIKEQLTDKVPPTELRRIFNGENTAKCFRESSEIDYLYFYLVEKPKEKKYRPYKDTDEMIADFLERYNSYSGNANKENPMYNPLIWIKDKAIGVEELITQSFGDSANGRSMEQLFKEFTYLDGSPCGKLKKRE